MSAKVTGADLRCECGKGARDVAPTYEIDEQCFGVSWTCFAGHRNICGWRDMPGCKQWNQKNLDAAPTQEEHMPKKTKKAVKTTKKVAAKKTAKRAKR